MIPFDNTTCIYHTCVGEKANKKVEKSKQTTCSVKVVDYLHCMTWCVANWIKLQLHRLSTIIYNNHVLSSADDRFAVKHAPNFVGPAKVIKVLSPVVNLQGEA